MVSVLEMTDSFVELCNVLVGEAEHFLVNASYTRVIRVHQCKQIFPDLSLLVEGWIPAK